jgi:hypothetical protein
MRVELDEFISSTSLSTSRVSHGNRDCEERDPILEFGEVFGGVQAVFSCVG